MRLTVSYNLICPPLLQFLFYRSESLVQPTYKVRLLHKGVNARREREIIWNSFGRLPTTMPKRYLSSLRAFWQLDGERGCKGHATFSVYRDLISIILPSSILFLFSLSLMSSRWNISNSISLIGGHLLFYKSKKRATWLVLLCWSVLLYTRGS